tara:strand:- start:763 stop:915 length:153 start_codon:yes stop_codon:yes gene_type:complete
MIENTFLKRSKILEENQVNLEALSSETTIIQQFHSIAGYENCSIISRGFS